MVPEFVDMQIKPELVTAINLVPSADEAMEVQDFAGALVCVQVWANTESMALSRPQKIIAADSKVFIS